MQSEMKHNERITMKLIAGRPTNNWATGIFDCEFAKKHRKNGLAGRQANKGGLHA